MSEAIRVRFAPSPTGSLHLGGVRTALYNYLLAKAKGGSFVIRVEDTDLERNQDDAADRQLGDLTWLGLTWDEGPDNPGKFGPYHQSERLDLYKKYALELVEQGKAFYCFLTDEELDALHSHENRQLKSPHRDLTQDEIKAKIADGEAYVIRFKNDAGDTPYPFDDLVHGKTVLSANMVGDFVLVRSNGHPVYNFCCAIDDHLMEISHVLRGEEHLSNTLRQLMIYEALGWEAPQFGHLSMILGPNRKKLSKRDDAAALSDFISAGFLPQALLNYVALLGWSSPDAKEFFSLAELTDAFDMSRVNKSPAMFDREKLRWINHQHLVALDAEQAREALAQVGVQENDTEWFGRFWGFLGHQFFTLDEVAKTRAYFKEMPDISAELDSEQKVVLSAFKSELEEQSEDVLDDEHFNAIVKA